MGGVWAKSPATSRRGWTFQPHRPSIRATPPCLLAQLAWPQRRLPTSRIKSASSSSRARFCTQAAGQGSEGQKVGWGASRSTVCAPKTLQALPAAALGRRRWRQLPAGEWHGGRRLPPGHASRQGACGTHLVKLPPKHAHHIAALRTRRLHRWWGSTRSMMSFSWRPLHIRLPSLPLSSPQATGTARPRLPDRRQACGLRAEAGGGSPPPTTPR